MKVVYTPAHLRHDPHVEFETSISHSPWEHIGRAEAIRATMRRLETRFPKGLRQAIVYDTTPFIEESVAEVFHTLRDAIILVAIVVLLFLQDWKATAVPALAVTST